MIVLCRPLRTLTVHPVETVTNTYGGNLTSVQNYQRPDRGNLDIQLTERQHEQTCNFAAHGFCPISNYEYLQTWS